eukprot:symbB.v1.2.001892.t1/scaffold101.1/size361152/6
MRPLAKMQQKDAVQHPDFCNTVPHSCAHISDVEVAGQTNLPAWKMRSGLMLKSNRISALGGHVGQWRNASIYLQDLWHLRCELHVTWLNLVIDASPWQWALLHLSSTKLDVDMISFGSALRICSQMSLWDTAGQVVDEMRLISMRPNHMCLNTLITASGGWQGALQQMDMADAVGISAASRSMNRYGDRGFGCFAKGGCLPEGF